MTTIASPRQRTRSSQSPRNAANSTQQDIGQKLANLREQVRRQFYPKLAVFQNLASYAGKHKRREYSKDPRREICRGYVDGFAYICDIRRGGNHVTAAAIIHHPRGHQIWLAANAGVNPEVKTYAQEVLTLLSRCHLHNRRSQVEKLFELVVEKTQPRLWAYKHKMQNSALLCRIQLLTGDWGRAEVVGDLYTVLDMFEKPPEETSLADLVTFCNELPKEILNQIERANYGPAGNVNASNLVHYIQRMGILKSHVDVLIDAVTKCPELRKISQVETIAAEAPHVFDIDTSHPFDIVKSSGRQSKDLRKALHVFVDIDQDMSANSGTIWPSTRPLKAYVHAEIQLQDHISRKINHSDYLQSFKFWDDDKYIGCSKPACYFCYLWLTLHPHKFIPPATHGKIISDCRGPEVDINPNGLIKLSNMYSRLEKRVSEDIIKFLVDKDAGAPTITHRHMSSAGSTPAPSILGDETMPAFAGLQSFRLDR